MITQELIDDLQAKLTEIEKEKYQATENVTNKAEQNEIAMGYYCQQIEVTAKTLAEAGLFELVDDSYAYGKEYFLAYWEIQNPKNKLIIVSEDTIKRYINVAGKGFEERPTSEEYKMHLLVEAAKEDPDKMDDLAAYMKERSKVVNLESYRKFR
ncbi:hypothetical protein ABEX78_32260 [Priestia megaterium]